MKEITNGIERVYTSPLDYMYHYSMFEERFDEKGEHDGFDRVWSMSSRHVHEDKEIIGMFLEGAEQHLVTRDEGQSCGKWIVTRDILQIRSYEEIL